MPIFLFAVLVLLPILCLYTLPAVPSIDFYSFFSELIMCFTLLASMYSLSRVKDKNKPNSYLLVGFSLLFTALYLDALDEVFVIPPVATTIVEDIFQIIGFLFVMFAIRFWLDMQKLQNKSLNKLAMTDSLTGCYTRRFFVQKLEEKLNSQSPRLCVLLFDIDHFKKVNDRYGHNLGDKALVEFSHLIQTQCREGDLFARWGGEEFILLLPNIALPTALKKAEALRMDVEALKIPYEHGEFSFTTSIGVSEYTTEIVSVEALIEEADQQLYLAKQSGRNKVIGSVTH